MINWGIVSTGYISGEFARGLKCAKNSKLKAVCSRKEESALRFAEKHETEIYFSSYEDMAKCDDVDVIYIGTPHICHLENVKLFLESGKHVVCEKPLGVNAGETIEMVKIAKKAGVFFLEGMWTRFFPCSLKAAEWVKNGEIGDVRFLNASFGYNGDGLGWRWDNAMAGGALLDVGVYTIAMAFAMLGSDYRDITGAAKVENGADTVSTAVLKYKNGTIANLSFSINQIMDNSLSVDGTKGRVSIETGAWWRGKSACLQKMGDGHFAHEGDTTLFEMPYESTGFQYEAMHVADCINKGLTESPLMTHEDSINIAKTMDKLRKIYGVEYEQD